MYFPSSQDLNWALQINHVRLDDNGRYECQATTHPPQSIVVRLRVVGKQDDEKYITSCH